MEYTWDYSKGSSPHYQCTVHDDENSETVCVTYHDEDESKAKLISLAPDLLNALIDFIDATDSPSDTIINKIGNNNKLTEFLMDEYNNRTAV